MLVFFINRLRDVILDGEVVAMDEYGRQDFRALMAGRGNLHYAVFEVLWLKGKAWALDTMGARCTTEQGEDLSLRKCLPAAVSP